MIYEVVKEMMSGFFFYHRRGGYVFIVAKRLAGWLESRSGCVRKGLVVFD